MKRMKRMQRDIRMGWMLKAGVVPAVIGLAVWMILAGMDERGRVVPVIEGCAVLLVVFLLGGFIIGTVRASSVRRRILKQGPGFEEDVFTRAGDSIWLGNEWLVYRRKEEVLAWRRDQTARVMVRSHNGLGTRADVVVYRKGSFAGDTIRLNATSYDLLRQLEGWPYTE